MLPSVVNRWTSARGRYQGACEQGHCALDGGETASKHETQIFVLVSYVLGTGQQGLRIQAGGRAARADMAFDLAGHDKFVAGPGPYFTVRSSRLGLTW